MLLMSILTMLISRFDILPGRCNNVDRDPYFFQTNDPKGGINHVVRGQASGGLDGRRALSCP